MFEELDQPSDGPLTGMWPESTPGLRNPEQINQFDERDTAGKFLYPFQLWLLANKCGIVNN